MEHFANDSVHDVMDLSLQVRYNKRLGFAAMWPPFAFLRQALLVDVNCSCAYFRGLYVLDLYFSSV